MAPKRNAVSYTNAELEATMIDLESDLVERKESAQDGRKIRRNICAFANDLPANGRPGVLLVGVGDDGSCASLTVDDALLTALANVAGEGLILPLPSMTVQKRVLRGCEVAVVTVSPSAEPPVWFQGRVWVRVGPSVREASVADEKRLGERRRAGDLPFDSKPAGRASLAELDAAFVREHYLPSAIDREVLRQNARSFEEQLHSLRLAHDGAPTWGALIALATDPLAFVPGASVQFLRLDGHAVTDPIVNQRHLAGRLDQVVRELNDLLAVNIAVPTRVAGSLAEQRRPECPLDALRQLAHNAIMHRGPNGRRQTIRGGRVEPRRRLAAQQLPLMLHALLATQADAPLDALLDTFLDALLDVRLPPLRHAFFQTHRHVLQVHVFRAASAPKRLRSRSSTMRAKA